MSEKIHISRSKHETAAQLERILAQPMLLVPAGARTVSRSGVIRSKDMQEVGAPQPGRPVRLPLFIDQQRKRDAGILAKDARVIAVTQTYRCQVGSVPVKFRLIFAQLRDVLAAENSSVVTKKDNHRRPLLPQRAQTDLVAIRVR